ncbi:(2Fe-2S)-binding protein [Mycobacterium mantenii]|uniref:(2Fe-2S)-binding protein n=1 Tax=Mycobacterium mantenii TaxID=560555 RepID=A0A1X0FMS9_MYCNT|nr:(2Fe-2S)-binding protein [Mycobacterium mantenii]BBY38046.1 (2Fe-2S)-binding protein [Mycobacterium mantenii]
MTSAQISGLTEAEAKGIETFEKPPVGSWTEAFGLDTGAIAYEDSFSREFYELETEAVFRRSWLNIGRVEDLPRRGSYFTKELRFLNASLLIIRGMDDEIRAFHNVCSHRGNQLVWDEFPGQETKGTCRAIACKFHGWRYGLDGSIQYVHNAAEFFDLEPERLGLPKVHLEVWAGFIFINLEKEPRHSLREFLGPDVVKLESYPFEKMTQTYVMESTIKANWKLFLDAFQEVYHVPYVHGKLNNPTGPATGVDKVPFMIPFFGKYGKHRLFTSGGQNANANVRSARPLDELFKGGFFGPIPVPDIGPLGDGINPARLPNWGLDSWQLYPNFVILCWSRNWYITYHYWPTDVNEHKFVFSAYFVPPRNATERLSQEYTISTMREFAIQDANTLAATQRMIETNARREFFLNDQEVLIRHLHKVVTDDVAAYRAELDSAGNGNGRNVNR